MKTYTNYIFDFDYTLFDTSKGMDLCYKESIRAIGKEYNAENLNTYVKESLETTFRRFSQAPNEFILFERTFLQTSAKYMSELSVPYNDTLSCLEALKSTNKHIYIVTGKPRERVVEILKKYACMDFISGIIGYGDYQQHKPSSESLDLCISKYCLSREETVYVGDSINDMTAAENAGIDGILITREPPHLGITSLLELIRTIKVELFTIMSSGFDIYKEKDGRSFLEAWSASCKYQISEITPSSVVVDIDSNTQLSISPNGIIILSEYIYPATINEPHAILSWKKEIDLKYKTDRQALPWKILHEYESFLTQKGLQRRCPFPSNVYYTLIAYHYVTIDQLLLNHPLIKQEILSLLTKNAIQCLPSDVSLKNELTKIGGVIENYSSTSFIGGVWGARLIASSDSNDTYYSDYIRIERNIQTLWIMLSLTNDYIDKKMVDEKKNKALSKLVNFAYDIMFFEAEFKYSKTKTLHRYQLNTIHLLLKLSNLNDISTYFKEKSTLLERKLLTSNNQIREENSNILNSILLVLTIVSSIAAIFEITNLWFSNEPSVNLSSTIISCIIVVVLIIISIGLKLYKKNYR